MALKLKKKKKKKKKKIFGHAVYGMQDLRSRPGIEPVPPAVEVQSLNHWTAREVPPTFSFNHDLSM